MERMEWVPPGCGRASDSPVRWEFNQMLQLTLVQSCDRAPPPTEFADVTHVGCFSTGTEP